MRIILPGKIIDIDMLSAKLDWAADYLLLRARQDSFTRKICPHVPVSACDLDRSIPTTIPRIVDDNVKKQNY